MDAIIEVQCQTLETDAVWPLGDFTFHAAMRLGQLTDAVGEGCWTG